ncbi:unnamed protein product [Colias eurytheme]|nr:unnamed protein product [Colias eurytheme]
MVSIVLLTTEEVLQSNRFWLCLDTMWITEDLEPFEEVKPEFLFSKPLPRDVYYAKYPDIPRSESEDENSLSVDGFKRKHHEWKSKIRIRKIDSRRFSSQSMYCMKSRNSSAVDVTRRVTSLVYANDVKISPNISTNSEDRVRDFFNRLIESIPPPPLEDTSEVDKSILKPPVTDNELNDFELPDYSEFVDDNMTRMNNNSTQGPFTSTIKRSSRNVHFMSSTNSLKTNSDCCDSWYESIYGVSDIIDGPSDGMHAITNESDRMSWSDVINICELSDNLLISRESLNSEKLISQYRRENDHISSISQENEDIAYEKFVIDKLNKTLKASVPDSSPLDYFDDYNNCVTLTTPNALIFGTFYRLTPNEEDSPPENELQKNSDRVLSEHELRVQRSLQKLNVPEWYKNAPAPREGFLLRKRLSDASSAARWSGLNSKTTSLGSLGANAQPPPPQLSPHTTSFGRWSTSRLNSNQTSPCSSTRSSIRGTSPLCSPSTRSSFSARQPYLGWRSQERLNSTPRTPHERLASSLLQQSASSKASEEIQTSIKEVTSAIVHYVSGLEPANGDADPDVSPRSSQKLYWLESSFVGTKPLESPQTPLVVTEALPPPHPRPPSSLRLDHRAAPDWQDSQRSLNVGITKPSPGSTTLEDVLDSLLGLPSQSARIPTPQPSPRKSSSPYYMLGGKSPRYEQLASSGHSSASAASRFMNTPSDAPSSFTDSPEQDRPGKDSVDTPATMSESRRPRSAQGDNSRRRSEPFTHHSISLDRRTSLDSTALRSEQLTRHESKTSLASLQTENSTDDAFVKCKFPKCTSRTPFAEAKRHYKTCHNCTTMYCSKECRRAHWEKHRKVCLHSRASALCRQIISAAKEDADSLHRVSTIAHQGYQAQGRGVVKIFFTSPEAAEKFTTHGYQYLSEPEFVKWTALQPNEMGVELYTEVVKLCKSYNPETRVILYVAVCIISEVPTKGAVKWERQMVSRCAKLRLSKTVSSVIQEQNRRRQRRDSKGTPEDRETLILTSRLCNAGEKNAATAHKFREICFRNICSELENRGVLLKKHFPEVYSRLAAYVDGTSDRFIPMTIYPKDVNSGKSFVCVIMPDSDVDSGTPVDGKVMTIDVGLDRSKHQLSTPM